MNSLDRIDRALSTRQTLEATYGMAADCINRAVPGDFVECGVFAGAQCAAMALAIKRIGVLERPRRIVHLFDSFEGVPAATLEDGDWLEADHPAGQSACSLQAVQTNMREWDIQENLLQYHPGWFHETAPYWGGKWAAEKKQIALLRLDGDLYESTRVCLEHLYPLLSPGGWLVIDDFGLDGCRKAVLDFFKNTLWPIYYQKP